MFDDEQFPTQVLANPGIIQLNVLSELENRTQGKVVPADPNNGFMFLLEANSSISSQIMLSGEAQFREIYPKRATSAANLYHSMSDYDYVDMMAAPASVDFSFILDRDELKARAVEYNTNYKKLVIPADTVISIGSRKYGIYYPIEIRINTRTDGFLIAYDTSEVNPLHVLSSNQIVFDAYTTQGRNLIKFTIPVYQFQLTIYDETVIEESGFNAAYDYTDSFYAARVFTFKDNAWKELAYTLSENVYDRNVATAQLKLLTDEARIQVMIPQIYLTTGQIGTRLRLELYTTKGALDVPITSEEAETCRVDFKARSDAATAYTAPMDALTYAIPFPAATRVLGGKSAISFEELRTRVIYGSSGSEVPVTPLDLENYIEDRGFTPTKYQDNITRRTYYANRKLVMGDSTPVPALTAKMAISNDAITNSDTILSFADDIVTVLPTTVFKYTESSGQCTPLTDSEITALSQMSAEDRVAALNGNIYTRQPFHIVLYTADKYPQAKTFNLNDPKVSSIQFVKENVSAVAQMSAIVADVLHNGTGTGGYTIRLGVSKTKELADVNESDLYVILTTQDRAGRMAYIRATKVDETDTVDVYHADIPTSYHITDDGYIRTTMTVSEAASATCDLELDTVFDVRMLVADGILPAESAGTLGSGIPQEFNTGFELIRQSIAVSFGEDLSNEIFNMTDAIWGPEQYATWAEDVYYTYPRDVYETDVTGALVYTVDGSNNIVLNKLHSVGDPVLDEFGDPLLQYAVGDIKRDAAGNPIVLQTRDLIYYVDALMLDAKLYESQGDDEVKYMAQISSEISTYASTISRIQDGLLELTDLYFRPIRTIGSADFSLGNGELARLNLGLGFTVKYYVNRGVMASTPLKQAIEGTTASVIESHMLKEVISVTDITKDLRDALNENIVSVDAVGINDTTVQTLIPTSKDVAPIVGLKLELQDDGTQILTKDITIEWAIAE